MRITDPYPEMDDSDWYETLYCLTQEQVELTKKQNSLAGIRDTKGTRLYFDFDSKANLPAAKKDTVELAHRLVNLGIDQDSIKVYFSGSKGFGLEVQLDKIISVEQFKKATRMLASGLNTFDPSISDPVRFIRLPNTKHPDSGLYKIPLELFEVDELDIKDILKLAENPRTLNYSSKFLAASLPEEYLKVEEPKKQEVVTQVNGLSDLLKTKPKNWKDYRWALLHGFFDSGERHNALLRLAAACRGMGFDENTTFFMCLSASKAQAARSGAAEFSETELKNNIIRGSVFGKNWNGGQFSPENDEWLRAYCSKLGFKTESTENSVIKLSDITGSFKSYVKNIEHNTIKTGLTSLDDKLFLSTGMNLGLIGAPGAGKSSIALNILNNTSKAGVQSVFASLDMHRNRMYEKVMYKVTGLRRDELYQVFKNDQEGRYVEKLKQEFGNVNFFHKSSPTVQDIRNYVLDCEQASGEKVKLVMVDYFERVLSDISDDTQSSKKVAGELQDLVNDLDVALVTLVQPNKFSLNGGPDSPIYDYTSIKGSSFLYQSFRAIVSIWRPFMNPKDFSKDKFLQMAILKNDLGELHELAFGWKGSTGEIRELEEFEHGDLEQMLQEKKLAKGDREDDWNSR